MTKEEAIRRIKSWNLDSDDMEVLSVVIPELAESEGERIRKFLIDYFGIIKSTLSDDGIWKGFQIEEILAFLEKQKENIEKEYVFRPLAGTDINSAASQAIRRVNKGDSLVLAFNEVYIPVRKGHDANKIVDIYHAFIEKRKEQKQGIKVRIPKFRVGDIIQRIPLETWDSTKKITSIDEHGYNYNLSHLGDTVSGGAIGFAFEDEYELVEQKPAEKLSKEDYVKKFKALCDVYEIKLPNREYDIYHLCDDLSKLSIDSGKQKPVEVKPRFKIGDTLKKKNKDYTFVVDKIQGGFYLTSDEHFFPIEEQDSWELLEQKPVELDEDTKMNLDRALQIIKKAKGNLQGYQSDDGIYECDKAIECLENFLYHGIEIEKTAEWRDVELTFRGEEVKVKRQFFRDDKGHEYSTTEQDEDVAWHALRAWCEKKGVSLYDLYPREEWSENDKDFINMLILHFNYLINKGGDSVETYKSYIKGLKSIPPQPHTVSIKDATKFGNLEYERGVKDGIQSEKSRQWKPSEEQVEALDDTIFFEKTVFRKKKLVSLLEDLKKLM